MESDVLSDYEERGIELLTEYEARQVLREYDLPCPTEVYVEADDFEDGRAFAERLESADGAPSYPLYLKAVSRDISSISDAGGVRRVSSPAEVPGAVDEILSGVREYDADATLEGMLATEDVSGETRELLLGSTVTPEFGHVVSLGVGGIYVEVYGDVTFRVTPLADGDARSMIDGLEGRELLDEFRGMPAVDREALTDVILRFSRLIEENPEISEVDVNPLMAGPDGVVVADALIRLS
jgi:acyl-CoA synthetase (NDP forming)